MKKILKLVVVHEAFDLRPRPRPRLQVPRPRRDRGVHQLVRGETEARRWKVSRRPRDRGFETEATSLMTRHGMITLQAFCSDEIDAIINIFALIKQYNS